MELRFAKYEGIGNDFIVVEGEDALGPPEAIAMCDRHLGVGADGVLLTGVRGGRPFMRVINADGSHAEMCGNGIRCVALHLVRAGLVEGTAFEVDTDAGVHACRVLDTGGAAEPGRVEVTMAVPELGPERVPVAADAPLVDAAWEVDGVTLHLTAVSMGNPHAVVFDDLGERRLVLGPRLEKDARFPKGVNVGFAQPGDAGGLALAVWERGVGWTRACGTGACAAAVAAVETGRATRGEPLDVHLPGGTLTIVAGVPGEPVRMTGPARHVFDGVVSLEGLAQELRPVS